MMAIVTPNPVHSIALNFFFCLGVTVLYGLYDTNGHVFLEDFQCGTRTTDKMTRRYRRISSRFTSNHGKVCLQKYEVAPDMLMPLAVCTTRVDGKFHEPGAFWHSITVSIIFVAMYSNLEWVAVTHCLGGDSFKHRIFGCRAVSQAKRGHTVAFWVVHIHGKHRKVMQTVSNLGIFRFITRDCLHLQRPKWLA